MDINTLDLKERYTEIKDIVIRHIRGDKKNVALVLSSGGARGLAHIGAIEELIERGYNIRSIAGTSMGALIAGMYATGHLDRFKEWMETIDRKKIFSLTDFSLSFDHLVKGHRIITALKEIVPDVRIEDLPIPYAAVATDWESGHEVVFTQGSLYDAIRASISLPAFLSPVKTGNKTLIDGGITNPLPLNRVERTKGDLLVAVNVSGHDYLGQTRIKKAAEKHELENSRALRLLKRIMPDDMHPEFNMYTLLNRTASIMIHQNAQLSIRLTPPDILVDISMKRYGGFDYDKSERLVNIGRRRMKESIDRYEG